MGTWTNSDGLLVLLGTSEATLAPGGDYEDTVAGQFVTEFYITLTSLTSTAADVGLGWLRLPSKSKVTQVDVIAQTAATSGGSATLNIGLKNAKTGADIGTADVGLVSAMALTAIDAEGETNKLTAGSSGAGGVVGTQISSTPVVVKLTAKYGTAAFTAGVVRVRVFTERMLTTA